MRKSSGNRIVAERAKRAFQAIVDPFESVEFGATDMSALLESIPAAYDEVKEIGNDLAPVLIEALASENYYARTLAAVFVLGERDNPTPIFSEATLRDASGVVKRGLQDESDYRRILTCLMLLQLPYPESIVSALVALLNEASVELRVAAAAVLCTRDESIPPVPEAVYVIGNALRESDGFVRAIASVGMLRIGARESDAARLFFASFLESEPETHLSLINALLWANPVARDVFPVLVLAANDESAHPYLRGAAAVAIGRVAAGSNEAVAPLMSLLEREEADIVVGAARGLALAKDVPLRGIQRLASLLSAADETMRVSAAVGLEAMGKRAEPAIGALIGRVGVERSVEVSAVVADALVSIGQATIPPLIEVLRSLDYPRLGPVAAVLGRIGREGAVALGDLMVETPELVLRAFILGTLKEMGPAASGALPALIATLDGTENEELAACAAAAIYGCAKQAFSAVPSLIQALCQRTDEVAWWATRALWQIGPEAYPQVETAIGDTRGEVRRRLESVLAVWRKADDSSTRMFEKVSPAKLLDSFVCVGEILEFCGTASWIQIADILQDQIEARRVAPVFATSVSSLRTDMSELSSQLGVTLISNARNRKGGLTPEGKRMLSLAKDYLAKKREAADG